MDNTMLGRWHQGEILRAVQHRQGQVPLDIVRARGAAADVVNRENLVHSPGCSVFATVSNPRDIAIARTAGIPCALSNDYTSVDDDYPWYAEVSLVPVLTSYQLHEHRAAGTAVVFIPAAWTTEDQLCGLVDRALSLHLFPLVGIGCAEEAAAARRSGAPAVAVDAVSLTQVAPGAVAEGMATVVIGGLAHPREVLSAARQGVKAVCVPARLAGESDMEAVQRLSTCRSMGTHPAVFSS